MTKLFNQWEQLNAVKPCSINYDTMSFGHALQKDTQNYFGVHNRDKRS